MARRPASAKKTAAKPAARKAAAKPAAKKTTTKKKASAAGTKSARGRGRPSTVKAWLISKGLAKKSGPDKGKPNKGLQVYRGYQQSVVPDKSSSTKTHIVVLNRRKAGMTDKERFVAQTTFEKTYPKTRKKTARNTSGQAVKSNKTRKIKDRQAGVKRGPKPAAKKPAARKPARTKARSKSMT